MQLITYIMRFVWLLLLAATFGKSELFTKTCGNPYDMCNLGDPSKLNVHLVPHTHDDVGWLKTVDQYFYGAYNTIQYAGVQYILDTVIPHLIEDPAKRFIYVEIAFFERWWREQDDAMKAKVKQLVDQRQLEFTLGGWCMNDEAATHYNAIIDQMTLGLRFINETFGPCARPLVAWQIDPFGHSREQASLFAQMGFDGLFFGRLDFADKELRSKEKRMEEIWRGSQSLEPPYADLFTGVNENGYGPPKGFCFDAFCTDEPIMDDPNLEDYNVDEKVKYFEDAAREQSRHFKTNHIIMTMGSDFQYSNAHTWYKNLDKLIKYVNVAENSNISVFYSTPSCYLYALNKAGKNWTVKTDDFFPYANSPHEYWTGYFTSRAGLKGYVRETNRLLQVCKQSEALAHNNALLKKLKDAGTSSYPLWEAMGVAQHHDAVSGTEKQHVADDYAKRLYKGRESCKAVISAALKGTEEYLTFCDYLNITVCNYTQQQTKFTVLVYNPLGRSVNTYIRVPISSSSSVFTVTDGSGNILESQIVPVSKSTLPVRRNRGNADADLVFEAKNVPAVGFSEYSVEKTAQRVNPKTDNLKHVIHRKEVKGGDVTIANEFYKVVFNGDTGQISTIVNTESGIVLPITQQLLWYNASMGNQRSKQQSGAYVFRPNSSTPFTCSQDGKVSLEVSEGSSPLVQEVHQKFSDWAWQVVRLYKGRRHIEVEWTIGPIPFHDGLGKEVITRYDTNLMTNAAFYTDANGREILKRVKDYRPTWKLNQSEPVAGNYYPVNSRIFMRDSKIQFTIVTDRSQGGASLNDGSLEVMLHRRLFGEDGKGVGECLNETGQWDDGLIVRGKHYILLDKLEDASKHHRELAEGIYMNPMIAFHEADSLTDISGLTTNLPRNVHLLTLFKTDDGYWLIRLEHQFQKDDDPELSKSVTVNIKNMFGGYEVIEMEELALAANAPKADITRLQWNSGSETGVETAKKLHLTDQFGVTLEPMQIKTYRIKVNHMK